MMIETEKDAHALVKAWSGHVNAERILAIAAEGQDMRASILRCSGHHNSAEQAEMCAKILRKRD